MEDWRLKAPPITPEESHINPPRFQRLNYNPNYYTPEEKDLNIGDDIVIGVYASDLNGNPHIKWIETTIDGLPLCEYYHPYVTCMRLIPIKVIRKQKLEKLNEKCITIQ